MQRRDFLRVVPAAFAIGAGPTYASVQGGLIDPHRPIWGQQNEPSSYPGVIRVEMTPVGPLPVLEMAGNLLLNADVFFEDLEWEKQGDLFLVKNSLGFLKRENAILKYHQSRKVAVCHGVVSLYLYQHCGHGGQMVGIKETSHSISFPIAGSAVETYRQ